MGMHSKAGTIVPGAHPSPDIAVRSWRAARHLKHGRSRSRMRIKSLSLKVALFAGAALAIVFAIGMTILVQQVTRTIETQTQQLQTETTGKIAAAVSAGLMHAERSAEGI